MDGMCTSFGAMTPGSTISSTSTIVHLDALHIGLLKLPAACLEYLEVFIGFEEFAVILKKFLNF